MDFVLFKGRDFSEQFNFKNAKGESIALPSTADFTLVLERGTYARGFDENDGLNRTRNNVTWRIDGEESADFEYSTYYYTLYMNDTELVRGILKVQ